MAIIKVWINFINCYKSELQIVFIGRGPYKVSPKKMGIQPTEVENPMKKEDLQYLQGDHLHKVSKWIKTNLQGEIGSKGNTWDEVLKDQQGLGPTTHMQRGQAS